MLSVLIPNLMANGATTNHERPFGSSTVRAFASDMGYQTSTPLNLDFGEGDTYPSIGANAGNGLAVEGRNFSLYGKGL